jgi:hypothetical protein
MGSGAKGNFFQLYLRIRRPSSESGAAAAGGDA